MRWEEASAAWQEQWEILRERLDSPERLLRGFDSRWMNERPILRAFFKQASLPQDTPGDNLLMAIFSGLPYKTVAWHAARRIGEATSRSPLRMDQIAALVAYVGAYSGVQASNVLCWHMSAMGPFPAAMTLPSPEQASSYKSMEARVFGDVDRCIDVLTSSVRDLLSGRNIPESVRAEELNPLAGAEKAQMLAAMASPPLSRRPDEDLVLLASAEFARHYVLSCRHFGQTNLQALAWRIEKENIANRGRGSKLLLDKMIPGMGAALYNRDTRLLTHVLEDPEKLVEFRLDLVSSGGFKDRLSLWGLCPDGDAKTSYQAVCYPEGHVSPGKLKEDGLLHGKWKYNAAKRLGVDCLALALETARFYAKNGLDRLPRRLRLGHALFREPEFDPSLLKHMAEAMAPHPGVFFDPAVQSPSGKAVDLGEWDRRDIPFLGDVFDLQAPERERGA